MTDLKTHKCDKLPAVGIHIFCDEDSSFRDHAVWQMHIIREATEEDLEENHHLEEVGETIWRTIVEISHCPYCGQNLYPTGHKLDDDHGEFGHVDSSCWR